MIGGCLKRAPFFYGVLLLVDHGHITLKEAYLDGTKIEVNAGYGSLGTTNTWKSMELEKVFGKKKPSHFDL